MAKALRRLRARVGPHSDPYRRASASLCDPAAELSMCNKSRAAMALLDPRLTRFRKDGGPDGRGVGFYFRNVTELILFGVRGNVFAATLSTLVLSAAPAPAAEMKVTRVGDVGHIEISGPIGPADDVTFSQIQNKEHFSHATVYLNSLDGFLHPAITIRPPLTPSPCP